MIEIEKIADIQEAVRASSSLFPLAGKSKSALSRPPKDVTALNFQPLSGILEYLPSEYTFTALAGTPLSTIAEALAEQSQYLPFDPPLVQQGATIGGTVAAGLSGSSRYRYGGVRDFIIGVRFVDGQGRLVQGGGKVVKNAAGFDLSKLMVGSLGRLGFLAELSFKVFPQPKAYRTLKLSYESIEGVIQAIYRLSLSSFDIECLDFAPIDFLPTQSQKSEISLWVRLGGLDDVLPQRLSHLQDWLGRDEGINAKVFDNTILEGEDEALFWRQINSFDWLSDDSALIKVPVSPKKIQQLESHLSATDAQRHYAVGGNLAWIGWPDAIEEIDKLLIQLGLSGLVVLGNSIQPQIGEPTDQLFLERVKQAIDPARKLGEL